MFSGKKIQEERIKNGFNRPQFLRVLMQNGLCISPQTLVGWEREIYEPKASAINIIAKALNKPIEYFFCNATWNANSKRKKNFLERGSHAVN